MRSHRHGLILAFIFEYGKLKTKEEASEGGTVDSVKRVKPAYVRTKLQSWIVRDDVVDDQIWR